MPFVLMPKCGKKPDEVRVIPRAELCENRFFLLEFTLVWRDKSFDSDQAVLLYTLSLGRSKSMIGANVLLTQCAPRKYGGTGGYT